MIRLSARSASASGMPMSAATFCSASGSSASTSSPMKTFDRPVPARDTRTDAVSLRATWQADDATAQASVTATSATWDNATHDGRGPAWSYAAPAGSQPGPNAMAVIIIPPAGQAKQLSGPLPTTSSPRATVDPPSSSRSPAVRPPPGRDGAARGFSSCCR